MAGFLPDHPPPLEGAPGDPRFLWPFYVLFTPQNLVLAPGLSRLQNAFTTDYTLIMTGGVLASIPVLIIYLFAQRYIIEGVSRSGLKG